MKTIMIARKTIWLVISLIAVCVLSGHPAKAYSSIDATLDMQIGPGSPTTMSGPLSVSECNGKLLVADSNNHRVLIYNTVPTSGTVSANVAIGQTNLTDHTANQGGGNPGPNTLNHPTAVFCDGSRVFVVDSNNHRVLIFNSIPTSHNASANIVIGQQNMISGQANQGGSIAANTLHTPHDVYYDGSKLYITDFFNHRVLIFNTIPASNNASANVVVGQATMNTANTNVDGSPTQSSIRFPESVVTDGIKMLITDGGNHRVLVYNTIPTSNGATPNYVIGQPNWTSGAANQGGNAANNSLSGPTKILLRGQKLFILDSSNGRVLMYNSIPLVNNASADTILSDTPISYAYGMAFGSNKLFVADQVRNQILVYDAAINPPLVQGVANNTTYYTDVTPVFSGIAVLDGIAFTSGTTVSTQGTHTLVVTDLEDDTGTTQFTISKVSSSVSTLAYNKKKSARRTISFTFYGLNLSKKVKKGWVTVRIGNKKAKTLRVRNSGSNLIVTTYLKYGRMARGTYDLTMTYKDKAGNRWNTGSRTQPGILTIQ